MSKTLAIQPAQWQTDEHDDAWDQAHATFIEGCGLPEWLAENSAYPSTLRVLETSFGLGVNCLATWAWLRSSARAAQTRLHYVAIEKHPFTQHDLRRALQLSLPSVLSAPAPLAEWAAALPTLADRLLAAWPPLIPGFHTLVLDEQTTLTLVFGDVDAMLPSIVGSFDAFYIDGLVPDHNTARWSDVTLSRLAALAAPGARVSSRRVDDRVHRVLATSGFEVRPGDSVFARWHGVRAQMSSVQPVIVVGAGIAGASMARQLAGRGMPVLVIERDRPAHGASGNPVAVVRPEPGGAGNPIAEFSAAGTGWLKSWLSVYGAQVPHEFCGALRMTRDRRRHDKLAVHAQSMPDEWMREVDAQQASSLCGQTLADDAFFLPQAAWVQAAPLVAAMLDHPLISLQAATEVKQLSPAESGGWQVILSDGSELHAAKVVLANAFGDLSPVALPLDRARGQLSSLPERAGRALQAIVCRDGYITPAVNGVHTIGATIQYNDEDGSARATDDAENFARLQRLLPSFAQSASEVQSGRVSWRSTTQDRLPLVGKLANGLYASLGHGSRGIACGPLCAEFLAALMLDEPLPLGREWVSRLDPLRFA